MITCALSYFLTAAIAVATANANPCGNPKINWGLCDKADPDGLRCGTLCVPLDYSNPASNETIELELVKIPSLLQTPIDTDQLSIQFNLGGPGVAARDFVAGNGTFPLLFRQALLDFTGGKYDLVTFNPRGTGRTLTFSTNDPAEEAKWEQDQNLGDFSDATLKNLWKESSVVAEKAPKNISSYIGTTFAARDVLSVADALDHDKKLRFWGLSYGTVVGATAAAMFPDRVDKLILDGVLNPHEYYHALADFESWSDSDQTFSGIFSTCVEAGDACPLTQGKKNATAKSLEQDTWRLLDEVKQRPITAGQAKLDYATLRTKIVNSLYAPTYLWPSLAELLSKLLYARGSISENDLEGAETDTFQVTASSLQNLGIHCSDKTVRESSFDKFRPTVDKLYNSGRFLANRTLGLQMSCAQWKNDAKERYQGDFHAKTAKPILLVGSSYDAFSSIHSARNVSSGFEGSAVLEVKGYGHTSFALPSRCLLDSVFSYWDNGTLPEPGKTCEVDAAPYTGKGWNEVFAGSKEYSNIKSGIDRQREMSLCTGVYGV